MWDDDEKRRKDDDAINAFLVGAVFAGIFALIFSLFKNAIRYPVAAGVIILGLYGFVRPFVGQTLHKFGGVFGAQVSPHHRKGQISF
jgi:hypothetical protein